MGVQQPVKLRKLNGGESVVGDLGERVTQEQLVDQAHTGLFHLLSGLGQEPILSPDWSLSAQSWRRVSWLGESNQDSYSPLYHPPYSCSSSRCSPSGSPWSWFSGYSTPTQPQEGRTWQEFCV